jgi:hypothetical protein
MLLLRVQVLMPKVQIAVIVLWENVFSHVIGFKKSILAIKSTTAISVQVTVNSFNTGKLRHI